MIFLRVLETFLAITAISLIITLAYKKVYDHVYFKGFKACRDILIPKQDDEKKPMPDQIHPDTVRVVKRRNGSYYENTFDTKYKY